MSDANPLIQRLQACKSELASVAITHASDAWWNLKGIFQGIEPLVRRFAPERLSEYQRIGSRVLFHSTPPESSSWEHRDPEWLRIVEKLRDAMTSLLDSLCDTIELENEVLGSRDAKPRSISPTGSDTVAVDVGNPDSLSSLQSDSTRGGPLDGGEESMRRGARKVRKRAVRPLSVPESTRWEDIIIELVNPDVARIRAREFEDNLTYEALGFRHLGKKHAEPRPLWELLLLLAKRGGRIQWDNDTPFDPDSRSNIKKQISDLRRHLKSLFPNVHGDPFKSYRKVRGYETAFRIQVGPAYRDDSR